MASIFLSGSISINNLNERFARDVEKLSHCHDLIVGDAKGADTLIQEYLKLIDARTVVIYFSGERARNNIGNWDSKSIKPKSSTRNRAFFTAKDIRMANDCDCGLMLWDLKSTGTLNNVIELIKRGKKSRVYICGSSDFVSVKDKSDLDKLLAYMSGPDYRQADKKIDLTNKIKSLNSK